MTLSVSVRGLTDVQAALRQLGGRAPFAVEGGLFEFGSLVEGEAKVLAPVDTGALRASGYTVTASLEHLGETTSIDPASRALAHTSPEAVRAVVGFGGPAQQYALVQHERTDYHHRVGQAKYLATALEHQINALPAVMIGRLRRELARWVS